MVIHELIFTCSCIVERSIMVETLRINNHDANERLTYQFRSNNNVFASNSGLFYKNTQYDMFIRDSCNENITKCFNGFYTL